MAYWHRGFLGKRKPENLAWRLRKAAENVRCEKTDLVDQLAVVIGPQPSGPTLLERVEKKGKTRRFVVVGIVKSIQQSKRADRWNIEFSDGWRQSLYLSCTVEQKDALLRSYPFAERILASTASPPSAYVVGLFLVTAKPQKAKATDRVYIQASMELGGFMETTGEFIPVSSDLERQTAAKLVQEGRTFSKPLRFDASTDLVFPDFELLDTGDEMGHPMEVFGRNDEPYQARRLEKEAYYKARYGVEGWWKWIVYGPERTAMPPFPPAMQSRRSVTI